MRGVVRFFDDGSGSPQLAGYRPQLKVGEIHTSCLIKGEEGQAFACDADHVVDFQLILQPPDFRLQAGATMGLYEGSRQVGVLTVLSEDQGGL